MTDIGLMVRSANPVPDQTPTLTEQELGAVLLVAKQRSGNVDAKEMVRPVQPVKKDNRRGWLVAVAAFAAVVVVAGVAVLLTRSTVEDIPPVTTPTTQAAAPTTVVEQSSTTTAIPAVSAEQLAVLAAFQEAFNAGDEIALREVVDPGAMFVQQFSENAANRGVDWIVGWMVHQNAQETAMDIVFDGCTRSGQKVGCNVHHVGDVPRTLIGVDARSTVTFLIRDGHILGLESVCTVCGTVSITDDFRKWVLSENPDEGALMMRDPAADGPEESGRLWLKWVRLWDEAGRP